MELSASHTITQHVDICDEFEKARKTKEILGKHPKEEKVIVFTGTKRNADSLTDELRRDGFSALALHGDKKQNERDWVMKEFKQGRCQVLVATDVAARGLGKCMA
jgi:ATP-dependent RNA helicase DDX5/DBP2